ncbi:hypothetical protein [Rhodosalinus sp. 5P4]|uniref:hypothetical protein n=1 Tax=Rhodosalinus sp. 5P4 TaxID=3239196 RepID=UPI003525236D
MHHFEFALRDFLNCEAAMDPKGIIMLHDVCPSTKAMASRDLGELAAKRPWTGDVWKTVVALLDHRPDLEIHLLDAEKTGLCVVHNLKPENTLLSDNYEKIVSEYINLDFNAVSPRFLYDRLPLEPAAGIAHRLPKSLKNT